MTSDADEKPPDASVNGHTADGNVVDEASPISNGAESDSHTLSESGSEHEDDTDDEDEEDEEPALKYVRIPGIAQELLKKDTLSALAVSKSETIAVATHSGLVHLLDSTGKRLKSYKPHTASIVDMEVDATGNYIATASIDGQVALISLNSPESYAFDMKRPMRTVALEPNFAKRSTRSFICGGLAGNLILREKGFFGYKETTLSSGEGPIWHVRWRDRLVAWANDLGVKVYDTVDRVRIAFIDRPASSPRPDLFKCTLHWQDDTTLHIAWADYIKVARIRTKQPSSPAQAGGTGLIVEVTAIFQLDCMIAGLTPYPTPSDSLRRGSITSLSTPSSFLVLTYTPPDTSFRDELTEDRAQQARKLAERPELRIISRSGEELAADALSVTNFESWSCNDYFLAEMERTSGDTRKWYVVLSPRDIILVKPRDQHDHIEWLVERRRYAEAMQELETIEGAGGELDDKHLTSQTVGLQYLEHLLNEGDFTAAAEICPKVCGHDPKRWEDWIFIFAEKRELQAVIPFVPTENPRLDHLVYEMILAHFLTHNREALLHTLREWPKEIYDVSAVIVAIRSELEKTASSSSAASVTPESRVLMECLAELYIMNRQPGKALTYVLRLRWPNVFQLIRENNLFTDVQEQVLLLVEFDHELMEKRGSGSESEAIKLLVDNYHSIPVGKVVKQLEARPQYLFRYLDALFAKDPYLVSEFADRHMELYAEYNPNRLIEFLRASTAYNLEKAYKVCQKRDLVVEMVFLLGHMGNNKKALNLIIERLGDVNRAIDFAKERRDNDLWEDLLKYSETRPAFIRGLLENVGPEINPVLLIRRIKDGLEIPGLKEALIKILQDFQVQNSLLEGCQTILNGDSAELSRKLQKYQTSGFSLTQQARCDVCKERRPSESIKLFLCRHVVHRGCGGEGSCPICR